MNISCSHNKKVSQSLVYHLPNLEHSIIGQTHPTCPKDLDCCRCSNNALLAEKI